MLRRALAGALLFLVFGIAAVVMNCARPERAIKRDHQFRTEIQPMALTKNIFIIYPAVHVGVILARREQPEYFLGDLDGSVCIFVGYRTKRNARCGVWRDESIDPFVSRIIEIWKIVVWQELSYSYCGNFSGWCFAAIADNQINHESLAYGRRSWFWSDALNSKPGPFIKSHLRFYEGQLIAEIDVGRSQTGPGNNSSDRANDNQPFGVAGDGTRPSHHFIIKALFIILGAVTGYILISRAVEFDVFGDESSHIRAKILALYTMGLASIMSATAILIQMTISAP